MARRSEVSFFFVLVVLASVLLTEVPAQTSRAENEKFLILVESGATLEWNVRKDKPPVLKIARIERGSQAEGLGYKKGDLILAIGEEAVDKHTLIECVRLSAGSERFHLSRDKSELDLPALFRAGDVIEGGVEHALKPGQSPPVLEARTLDGGSVRLNQFEGRVVLISFWAKWCKPCMEELPGLVDLHRRYHDRGLVVLSVNLDNERGAPLAAVRSTSSSFLLLQDRGMDSPTANRFGVQSLPTSVLIDRAGLIRQVTTGYSAQHFELAIEKPLELLLEGKTAAVTILARR